MMPHCACGSVTNSSESGEPLVRVVSRGEHILLRPSSPSVVDASLLELERGILAWTGGWAARAGTALRLRTGHVAISPLVN